MSPPRKRKAVLELPAQFVTSERRACGLRKSAFSIATVERRAVVSIRMLALGKIVCHTLQQQRTC